MRKKRLIAGTMVFLLVVGMACGALGEFRRTRGGSCSLWGVMYEDALLLAQADGEAPEDEAEVVFIWPLWDALLRFFGFL